MNRTKLRIFFDIFEFSSMTSIAIIGGGAAGAFCAAELSRLHPDWIITVLEAGARPMAKLAITGGGRCNITNTFAGVESLESVYPRGARLMKRALGRFGWKDCLEWFKARGVLFTVQEDQCVFPASQDAMQIVRTLEREMRLGGVQVMCRCRVLKIDSDLTITFSSPERSETLLGQGQYSHSIKPDRVILASGGGTAEILSGTGIHLEPPVPSLFTLKLSDSGLRALMGITVQNVRLGLAGTKFRSTGTLLLTDWGVSGPATLKLSSYAARHLAEKGYKGTLLVNWLDADEETATEMLSSLSCSAGKMLVNTHPQQLSERLWRFLLEKAKIRPDCRWGELGGKGRARLLNILTADTYEITGRARFKEEFVTCGGVSLSEINPDTMQARGIDGLYCCGEVLDIDAVTGGFNLQAAWSTAWIAAHSI